MSVPLFSSTVHCAALWPYPIYGPASVQAALNLTLNPLTDIHHHSLVLATLPYLSDSAGFYLRPHIAQFSHSGPFYLHIWKGWSCHGMVLLPVVTTVNMGAQCLEAILFVHVLLYLNISRNPLDPFPLTSCPPFSFTTMPLSFFL